jgi:hypothetical protein
MSQKVDIVCDRCGVVIEGKASEGAGPHWDLSFHSTARIEEGRYEGSFEWRTVSWDLCQDCARLVGRSFVGMGLKVSDYWKEEHRKALLGETADA